MNKLFTFKARVILFSLLICHLGLKAQSVSDTKTDTLAKRNDTSYAIKADTSFAVRAGSTVVIKADTTLVINADAALLKKLRAMSESSPDSILAKKASDILASTGPAATTTDPVSDTTKKAASSVGKITTIAPPLDGVIQVKNTATQSGNGQIEVRDSAGMIRLRDTTTKDISLKTDSSIAKNTDGSAAAKDQGTASTKDATSVPVNATPAINTDAANTNKTDTPAASNTDAASGALKADTTLAKKADTTLVKKIDTALVKKSDTTMVQKDTIPAEIKAQNVYLEVGGAGLAISANYDTRFHKERNGWGYRVGLGFFSSGGNTVFSVPFQINYLLGEHAHMLELGAGTTFLNSTGTNVGNSKWEFDKVTGFIATATIGYRFQPAHKGINFRLAFTPILYDEGLIPAGGVSIGYTFK